MFLGFMLSYSPKESLMGLTLIAAGAVFYWLTAKPASATSN
jgi:hypothetical protein